MRVGLAVALFTMTIGARASADTLLFGELGAGWYNGTLAASRGADGGRIGLDGPSARVRVGAGFEVARGLFLGPAAGVDAAFVDSTREVCCGGYRRVDLMRVGLEGMYYVDRRVGFRIHAGFGYALAGLRADDEGRATPGALGNVAPGGIYWTAAIARDYPLGKHTRIGGVVRLEADALSGRSDDHLYTVHAFTPSLSLVLVHR